MFLTCWDVDRERPISAWQWEPRPRGARANQITWSPNGKWIAFVTAGDIGDNGTTYWADHLNVIDAATGRRIFKRHPQGQRQPTIRTLQWNSASSLMALGTEEGRVEVVELASKRLVFSQKIHADMIHSLAWRPDSSRLATSAVDGTVKIITGSSGQPLLTFNLAERSGSKLAWSADGRRLAAVSTDGALQTWDATPGYEIAAGGKRRGELAWAYFDRARASSGEETRLALHETLRHAPDALDFWDLRGSSHAILGEYNQAAEEFSKNVF
jgi:WD40 repeat protein